MKILATTEASSRKSLATSGAFVASMVAERVQESWVKEL